MEWFSRDCVGSVAAEEVGGNTIMSGGTPRGGGGYIRQRHSQGYASGGDDLEDDACSRHQPFSLESPRCKTWVEVLENVLWIASAVFIVYFGDMHSNMIYILLHDARIKRMPLYLGMLGIGVNVVIIIYESMLSWSMRRFDEKWELWSISALPFITLLGIISFCLLSFALWPIWGFLTLPLLFTLFMACLVVFPHLTIIKLRPQNEELRID